jgi:hypothetical protein
LIKPKSSLGEALKYFCQKPRLSSLIQYLQFINYETKANVKEMI